MEHSEETAVIDEQSHLIDKTIAQQQILLEGYRKLLAILHRHGNITKQELSGSIIETLKNYNEI